MSTNRTVTALIGAGASLAAAIFVASPEAHAQSILSGNSRGMAGALIAGGGYGRGAGGGRVDLEYQFHFTGRYQGAGLGLGVTLPLWYGFGIGFEGRFMYDIQPISNIAFFISPYVGLSTGFWNYQCGGGRSCGAFWIGPELGLELKLVLFDRLLLGLRPIGFSIPILFGGAGADVGWGYHGAFTIGVTF